jgi:hypothetical protein
VAFQHREDATIDTVIASLQKKYQLKDEGEVQDFLGIRIRKEIDPQTN